MPRRSKLTCVYLRPAWRIPVHATILEVNIYIDCYRRVETLTSRRLSLAMRRVPLRTVRVVCPRQTTLSERRWLAHFMHLDAHCSRAVVALSLSGTRREHRLPPGGLTIDERLTPLCLLEYRDCNGMSMVLIVPRRPEMHTYQRSSHA